MYLLSLLGTVFAFYVPLARCGSAWDSCIGWNYNISPQEVILEANCLVTNGSRRETTRLDLNSCFRNDDGNLYVSLVKYKQYIS
jgi:hypothetical protein